MAASPPIEGDISRLSDAVAPLKGTEGMGGMRQVNFKLTGHTDVNAAHAYFATGGTSAAYLPDIPMHGLDASAAAPQAAGAESAIAAPHATGAEGAIAATPAPGAESVAAAHVGGTEALATHALGEGAVAGASAGAIHAGGAETLAMHMAEKLGEGAAAGAGAQAMSPIMSMIMRMPGHIGLASSFFEFLGNFFMPGQALSALDPIHLLAEHAGAAMGSLAHVGNELASHLSVHLLPENGLLNGMHDTVFAHGSLLHNHELTAQAVDAKDAASGEATQKIAFNNAPQNGFQSAAERSSEMNTSINDGGAQTAATLQSDHQYIAWDSGSAFRPTLTGAQQPGAPDPTTAATSQPYQPQATTAPTQASQPSAVESVMNKPQHAAESAQPQNAQPASDRGSMLDRGHPAETANNAAVNDASSSPADSTAGGGGDAQSGTIDYTVKHGDNLWDIAHKHLGDGTKWDDIYKMNQNVIGDKPALIQEGAHLQLPSNAKVAADYTVKPGDNLWDISQNQLGGGQHWKDLYNGNEGVIGSNPSMIHPGQHLDLPGNGAQGAAPEVHSHTLAQAPHTHHAVHLAHNHIGNNHIADARHGATHHSVTQADHAKVASDDLASKGPEVALRAQPGQLGNGGQ